MPKEISHSAVSHAMNSEVLQASWTTYKKAEELNPAETLRLLHHI